MRTSDTQCPSELVTIERSLVADVCWLLASVRDFCHFADPEAVAYLLDYADDRLSGDGLATIARSYASQLAQSLEEAP